ncbi:MAG: Uxx-star family glutaredoxin-like (seleno)protein [Patescibacteria group bacterium]
MKITIYSTPTCPYCKLTKEFLKEKGIAFADIDVSSDPAAANEMVKKSGQMGVPVIDIDGQIIVGWNKGALEEAIGMKAKA